MTTTPTAEKCIAFRTLADTEQAALKSRAREAIKGCWYIGTDADGRFHFFAPATRSVAVFEDVSDLDPDTYALRELPIPDSPRAWAEHVYRQAGPWAELRIGSHANARQLEMPDPKVRA